MLRCCQSISAAVAVMLAMLPVASAQKALLPNGPAPNFFLVVQLKKDGVLLTPGDHARGTPSAHYLPAFKELNSFDAAGNVLTADELRKRLKPGDMILLSANENRVDPAYLTVLKNETIVVVWKKLTDRDVYVPPVPPPIFAGPTEPKFVPADDRAVGRDKKLLLGTWILVSAEENSRDSRDVAKGMKVVFSTETVTHWIGGEKREASYKIDPTTTPKRIDFTFEANGVKVPNRGIYELDGDMLRLCFRETELTPSEQKIVVAERPKELNSKNSHLFTLKRESK